MRQSGYGNRKQARWPTPYIKYEDVRSVDVQEHTPSTRKDRTNEVFGLDLSSAG